MAEEFSLVHGQARTPLRTCCGGLMVLVLGLLQVLVSLLFVLLTVPLLRFVLVWLVCVCVVSVA